MTVPVATRLHFRLSLWCAARLLPWRVRQQPLDAVLGLAEPAVPGRFAGLAAPYVVHRILRTTRHPWLMRDRRCLRQGLLGYRFLAEAGLRPELHFGLDAASLDADRLSAHCWVCLDGRPVLSERLPGMVTILVHPRGPIAAAAAGQGA